MMVRFGIVLLIGMGLSETSCQRKSDISGCTIPPADLTIVWPAAVDSIRIMDGAGLNCDYGMTLETDPVRATTRVRIPGNSLPGQIPFPMIISDGKRLIVLEGDLVTAACGGDCTCYRYTGLRGEGILSADSTQAGYLVLVDTFPPAAER